MAATQSTTMLHRSLPIVPKPSSSSTQVTNEPADALTNYSSTVGSQPQYYHSTDNAARLEPYSHVEQAVLTPADSQTSLEETRREALRTLAMCRHVIASLELTRLRNSRKGLYNWLGFWDRLYERSFSRLLSSRVYSALYKVDALFRAVSTDLHALTQRMEFAVGNASSEKEILHILETMEDEVGVRRRRRRRKAQHTLNKMRANIEAIPVTVNETLFDDMKRGVFALDVFCDYHPGDPAAELSESMWPEHFLEQPVGCVAVSPHLYRQWQQQSSAAAGAYMPLSTYSSNTVWVDAPEEWGHDINGEYNQRAQQGSL